MDKKSTLDSKLKNYALLAGGITAVAGAANAQIGYTDVNPDATVTNIGTNGGASFYGIDFDSDGNLDVGFFGWATTGRTGTVSSGIAYTWSYDAVNVYVPVGGGNAFVGTAGTSSYPLAMSSGNVIGSSANFIQGKPLGSASSYGYGTVAGTSQVYFAGYGTFSSSWGTFNNQEAFVGVKFNIGGAPHYGWVRVQSTGVGGDLIIKDYAYNTQPDQPIVAGDIASIEDKVAAMVDVVCFNNNLKIDLNGEFDKAELTVLSVSGQEVAKESINTSSYEMSLNSLTTGIYLASVKVDGGVITKRVYVK